MSKAITARTVTFCSLSFCVLGLASPRGEQLSLRRGLYVIASVSCKEPPFAAMQSWDGVGFFGPHSSRCTSHVLSQQGKQFQIRTACKAVGDGSPLSTGQVDIEDITLVRLSNVRFEKSSGMKPKTTYRWCSADNGLGNFSKAKP